MELVESPSNIITLPVAAAAELKKSRFVDAGGNIAGNGERPVGIAYDNYAAGENVAVITSGTALVVAGAAVSVGDDIQSDAEGRAIPQASGKVAGLALSAASIAGKLVLVKLLVLLLMVISGTMLSPSPVAAQGSYELTAEVKAAQLHVAAPNKYILKTITATRADSLTIVAKISDSTQATFYCHSTSPDGVYLDSPSLIPTLTATNAPKYTSATISASASRFNILTLAMDAKSTRATTASITADGVKVWIYYHTNKR